MLLSLQGPLEHEEIIGGVTVLTALAKVNQAIDTGNRDLVYQALQVNMTYKILNDFQYCSDFFVECKQLKS